jgi:signal transduction histidine kinase
MMPDRVNLNRLFFILILTGILPFGLACRNALAKADWLGVLLYTGVYLWICVSAFFISILYRNMAENFSRQRVLEEKLIQAEKFKALALLADSAAHDLNNILSGLATYPEILMMDPGLDPRLRQGLSLIKDSGRKAADVVGDLLTISRGAGEDMETLQINAVLERYLCSRDFEKIKAAYKEVDIEFCAEPELLMIRGAYLHIEKIIMNLVLNAVENVSETTGGRVTITTANRFIDPSMPGFEDMGQGDYAVLTVADNGPGMDEERSGKIFEPFFTTRELGRGGTGLGLTLVRHAVQDHRGFIRASSHAGRTRFDLFFPALRPDISRKPGKGHPEPDDAPAARDSCAGSFVKKPYTLMDMGIAIKEELENEWKS